MTDTKARLPDAFGRDIVNPEERSAVPKRTFDTLDTFGSYIGGVQ